MAWNKPETKSLTAPSTKSYQVGPGAPVAITPSLAGRAYKDGWNIDRAYDEAMRKVTWVYRCIDAIAGNQSRLPVILRKDNDPRGEILKKPTDVSRLLNSRANKGENSAAFRYRVSSQLLMSTRGVFIEKVFSRSGELLSLNLLPPGLTAPIPDPVNFVSGFEVTLPTGGFAILKPENVLWIRKPHPLDPYLSLTPMESAGVAIEIENLAKTYNRNFLQQDGRPGMMLILRDEVDPDDREELEARFSGGPQRAGRTTVVSAESGIDVIDTSSTPRDAAYIEMRNITKEEILAAFGVPEPAIGNSSGRSFANAAEEMRVFWMETMLPHLELVARALDELDDDNYVDFDTSEVPILILVKQERERHLMEEVNKALTSVNEYREATGRKATESELADSLLSNPNLTPIANTKKKFEPQQQAPIDAPLPAPGDTPPADAQTPPADAQSPPSDAQSPPSDVAPSTGPLIQASLQHYDVEYKDASDPTVDRWAEVLDLAMVRLFERQERVVREKVGGPKMKKNGNVSQVYDLAVWSKQLNEDLRPIIKSIALDAAKETSTSLGSTDPVDVDTEVDAQMERIQKMNETIKEDLAAAFVAPLQMGNEDEMSVALKAAVVLVFLHLMKNRRRAAAESEAQAAWNGGVFSAMESVGVSSSAVDRADAVATGGIGSGLGSAGRKLRKTWVSQKDNRVRSAHVELDGQTIPVKDAFHFDGIPIRYPGDPLAPANLTINCRCKLRFRA